MVGHRPWSKRNAEIDFKYINEINYISRIPSNIFGIIQIGKIEVSFQKNFATIFYKDYIGNSIGDGLFILYSLFF